MSTAAGSAARASARRLAGVLDRMGRGSQRPIEHLRDVRHVRIMLDRIEADLVQAARDAGYTYGEIGRCLGVSRQAARVAALRRAAPKTHEQAFDAYLVTLQARQRQKAQNERWSS